MWDLTIEVCATPPARGRGVKEHPQYVFIAGDSPAGSSTIFAMIVPAVLTIVPSIIAPFVAFVSAFAASATEDCAPGCR